MPPQRIKISSVDRISPGGSPSDFTIQSQVAFEGIYRLHWIYCPLTFPNINSRNNKIYFRENGVDKVALIEIGMYTSYSTLIDKAVTALNTVSAGVNTYSMSFSAFDGVMTVVSDTMEFAFTFGSHTEASAAEILGFAATDSESSSLSLVGVRNPNLSSTQTLNISINKISTICDTKTNAQATFTVPIQVNLGGIVFWTPPDSCPELFEFQHRTTTLQIQVTDDAQQVLPLQNEWHCVIGKVN